MHGVSTQNSVQNLGLGPLIIFRKYHGLGNDYLIPTDTPFVTPTEIDANLVRQVCNPHYGLGSDGILYGPYLPETTFFQRLGIQDAKCAFRILNPDGSEAEKSGNGVRIFCRYLYDKGMVALHEDFTLATLGGPIRCRIDDPENAIRAEMGRLSFDSAVIPVVGPRREVVREHFMIDGQELEYCAVTIGNPHCVIPCPQGISKELACRLGPIIECEKRFPNRTNVQFIAPVDRHAIRAEIFERGAGYTLASGTSACACAAVAVKLDWCESPVTVRMPGGELTIQLSADFDATQCGPVHHIYDAEYHDA